MAPSPHGVTQLVSLAAGGRFVGTFTGRVGVNVDVDHPQPGLWTGGEMQFQTGPVSFPTLSGDGPLW